MKFIVTKWFMKNAKAQDDKMTVKQAEDLYEIYSKKVEFHSPRKTTRNAGDIKGGYWYDFRIRVGTPVIRGSKRMTMPSMSLQFEVGSSCVNIFTDLDLYLKGPIAIPKLQEIAKWMGLEEDSSAGWEISRNQVSIHPHIGSGGSPCLGDFNQPWAVCVAQGNLPMLVNITKSFLNNWTRNDAYWDINHRYAAWTESGKLLDWKTDICLWSIIQKFAYSRDMSPQTTSYRSLGKFIRSDSLSQLLSLGWSKEEAYLYWGITSYLMSNKSDLEGKTLLRGASNSVDFINFIDATDRDIEDRIQSLNMIRHQGLMDPALTGEFGVTHPHNHMTHTSIWQSGEWNWVKGGLQGLRDMLRDMASVPARDVRPDAHSILKANSYFRNNKYLRIAQPADLENVCYQIGRGFYSHRATSSNLWIMFYQRILRYYIASFKDEVLYTDLIPFNSNFTNWDHLQLWAQKTKSDGTGGAEVGYKKYFYGPYKSYQSNLGLYLIGIVDMIKLNHNHLFSPSDPRPDLYNKLRHEVLADTLEGVKLQLTTKIRKVTDERNKSSRRAYGAHTQSDSRENQLSIETF